MKSIFDNLFGIRVNKVMYKYENTILKNHSKKIDQKN